MFKSFSRRDGGYITGNRCHLIVLRIETDESAVCALPFRLTASGILFTILLLLSSVYLFSFLDGAKEKEALTEISKLTAASEQLSFRGEGSEVILEIRIPEGVKVDFGSLPGRQDKWPADANDYCIYVEKKATFYYSDASFSNPQFNGPVSLGSGRHRLLLSTKVEPKLGRLFVLISEKQILNNV